MSSAPVQGAEGPSGAQMLGSMWALCGFALVLLSARAYTSSVITERVRLDLYFAIFTFLCCTLASALSTIGIYYGLGKHQALLEPVQIVLALKYTWAGIIVALFAIPMGKLTIVAFLVQLHNQGDHRRIAFLWCAAVSNLIINAITVAMALASCSPVAKLWNHSLPGTCDGILRNQHCAYFQGSWSALIDLVLAVYPITFIYKLQMPKIVKIGLCSILGLGVVACACATVKTIKLAALSQSTDITFIMGGLCAWNLAEMWVIFIVSCIPPVRKLLANIAQHVTGKVRTQPSGGDIYGDASFMELSKPSGCRSQYRAFASNHTRQEDDAESQEEILGIEGRIRKTEVTTIDFEEREDVSRTWDVVDPDKVHAEPTT